MKEVSLNSRRELFLWMAFIFFATACASTKTDSKVENKEAIAPKAPLPMVERNAATSNGQSTHDAVGKTETVAVKMPDADWLNKEEPRTKIWEYTPPPPNPDRHASPIADSAEYRISQVEISNSSLFLHVKHKLRVPSDVKIRKSSMNEAPNFEMLVNGCPVQNPRFAGVVEYDGGEPSLIAIPRMDLPEGDIELHVTTFGRETNIVLMNYEDGLEVMTSKKQSRWYQEEVEKQGRNTLDYSGIRYPDQARCDGEITEE